MAVTIAFLLALRGAVVAVLALVVRLLLAWVGLVAGAIGGLLLAAMRLLLPSMFRGHWGVVVVALVIRAVAGGATTAPAAAATTGIPRMPSIAVELT